MDHACDRHREAPLPLRQPRRFPGEPRGAAAWILIGLAALLALAGAAAEVAWSAEASPRPARPLVFEANRGQADERVRFFARGAGYTLFLTEADGVVSLAAPGRPRAALRIRPVGARRAAEILGEDALPGRVHYERGAVSAPTYAAVRYRGVYAGIDLVYYGRPRALEYDFVVGPGADPAQIALAFDGAAMPTVDARGDLLLRTPAGDVRQPRPVVYQEIDGARVPVRGDYAVGDDGLVRFALGPYDASRTLVIDPVLAYSTYLGGSDEEGDWLYGGVVGIRADAAGNVYVVGTTRSVDFPTTPGADRTLGGDQDVFVTKLSPAGELVYSTFLGGPCDDVGRGIAIDAQGSAYVTGRAHGGTCYEDVSAGVLVAKLSPAGVPVYSLVFGGSLADSSIGQAIAVDATGHAYVTGLAQSNSRDFPTTPGAYRTADCGVLPEAWGADGFVAKVNPAGTALVYSTYLCGSSHESPNGIAVDAAGNVYVAGSTDSHDFPTVSALQPEHRGGPNATTGFVSKLAADGARLIFSTYLGGSVRDFPMGIALDQSGHVYVGGGSRSDDFPTTPGTVQPTPGNSLCFAALCKRGFVTKMDPNGTRLVYSTFLHGEGDGAVHAIAVDATGAAYVTGFTAGLYFPVADAFQWVNRGYEDAFVAKLSPDASRLVYSSYLGGSIGPSTSLEGLDSGTGIAIDAAGNAYVAGYTASRDFPTTPGARQPEIGGGVCDFYGTPCGDAFVTKVTAGGPGITPARHVTVTPWEVSPGAALTATWAGLPMPSANDRLDLYLLGALAWGSDIVASRPTTGQAAGTLAVALPADLPPATYELRVMSGDPAFDGLIQVMARSRPIRVGAPAPDLVVATLAVAPAAPVAGQPVALTITVSNQGAGAAGPSTVEVYANRAAAPPPGTAGDARCAIGALAAGASSQCTATVTYAAAGAFSAWAQADSGQVLAESAEDNNVAGPRAITVTPPRPDLVVAAVGAPPASAAPGAVLSIPHTIKNVGAGSAGASTARFYLSADAARDAADTLLTGSRAVAPLAAGAQSAGTASATIPAATPLGTYLVLACADDAGAVAESDETNNCTASAGTIRVGRADLVPIALGNPPATTRPGTAFSIADTVANQGALSAGASSTRYYLSADAQRGAGDVLLTGQRAVGALAAGAASSGTATVTVPATVAPGPYFVLACADDAKVVVESDEANNCRASAAPVAVALPDLVQASITVPSGPVRRGVAFAVTDTVTNDAPVALPRTATTRYYLSADAVRGAGDVLLAASRTVPALAAGAASTGSASLVVPASTAPGPYFVLACADDSKLVAERVETNNCRTSAAISVTP